MILIYKDIRFLVSFLLQFNNRLLLSPLFSSGDFSFSLFLPFITLSFLSVYGALPSCTYIIEAIYNTGEKDSFQFIKKANTDRIMEETKRWEIERTKWKRKKRDWRLLMVKPMSKRIYLFAGLRTPRKNRKQPCVWRWNNTQMPWRAVLKWRAKIKNALADWFLIWQSQQIGQKIKEILADRLLIWRSSANWVTQKDGPTASEIQVGVLSFNG